MKSISFLEKKGIDIKKSLELFGDEKKYNENLGSFLVGIHSNINKMIEFMQQKDLSNYAVYAHSMKTDAKYFGFNDLAKMAEDHEKKAKDGDIFYIGNNINDLITETNNAIVLVQEYMNDSEVAENIKSDNSDVYDRKTILVADDSNIIRNFVKRIFEDEYNVGVAKDGEEAIKIIDANKDNGLIEVLLLDLNMPKADGFAVLEFMRKNDLLDKIPVSIISGDSSKETIDRAFTYDIVDMINKPFNEESIKSVIEKTLIFKSNKE